MDKTKPGAKLARMALCFSLAPLIIAPLIVWIGISIMKNYTSPDYGWTVFGIVGATILVVYVGEAMLSLVGIVLGIKARRLANVANLENGEATAAIVLGIIQCLPLGFFILIEVISIVGTIIHGL